MTKMAQSQKFKLGICRILALSLVFLLLQASNGNSETPHIRDENVILGIEHLYNSEFEKAEKIFYRVVEKHPKNPIGYFYLAMVTWSRLASGFWSKDVVKEYDKRINKAIAIARKRIENEETDSYVYFYLGGALGFKGRIRLMERRWIASFFLALEAVDALKTCLRINPNNRDVLFGLGIFDYYTARLSGALRFWTYLLIRKGDKVEGLRKLHIAADEAPYSSIEAKSLLAHIYLFLETRHQHKALPLAIELSERFPQNPRHHFLKGVSYFRMGKDAAYREVADQLRKRSTRESSKTRVLIWRNQARYLEASYYLFHGQHDMAESKLASILAQVDPSTDPIMSVFPILKKGMIADIDGDREQALTYYKDILKMKNGAGAQFFAEKFIKEPAKKGDPFLGY